MDDLVRIEPTRGRVTTSHGEVAVLEIELGGCPRGLVLLLGDTKGLGHEASETMNRLAEHGYETLAACVPARGFGDLVGVLIDRAKNRGWAAEQVAILGVGVGGRGALMAAMAEEVAAAVSVSPTFGSVSDAVAAEPLPDLVDVLRTPWLGLFGEHDAAVGPEELVELRSVLDARSDVFSRVVRYPGVGRDFHERSADGVSYAASYDGWQRVIEWLDARVAPRLTPLAMAWRDRHAG
jgi:carboxymethylenebutenolidase